MGYIDFSNLCLSYLNRTGEINRGKILYLLKCKTTLWWPPLLHPPPPQKTSAKKKYFTINCIQLIHKACQILLTSTSQCHCLHLHSQCLHLPYPHSKHPHSLHCHSTTYHYQSLLWHWIYSTFKNLSQSLLVKCAVMSVWSILTKYYIYVSWFINFLEPINIQNCLHRCHYWC